MRQKSLSAIGRRSLGISVRGWGSEVVRFIDMENRYSFSDHVSDPPPAARTIHMASRSATYAGVPAIIIFDRTLNIGRIITP